MQLSLSFLSAALSLLALGAHALHPETLASLEQRAALDPSSVEFFHHDTATVRALQALVDDAGLGATNVDVPSSSESAATAQRRRAQQLSGFTPELTRRAAQISGLQTRCTASKCLALTFDDGPYLYHQGIANQFSKAGGKATFFVNGYNFGCIYDVANVQSIRRSLAQGHQIASHTWGHPHLMTLTYPQVDKQVQLLEEALLKVAGIVPAFIRPPYGETNETLTKYLNERHGLVVVNWNYDAEDAGGESVDYSLNVIRSIKAPTHAIVLQHETVPTTNSSLVPRELPILRQNGYTNFMTVAASLGANPYKVKTNFQARDATWTCAGKPLPGQAQ